jgi:SDR family mycofactocin-dependent oxidoreductase
MAGRLEGKVVFITGVARGQGRSHAVRFAEEGADIIGIDICEQIDSVGYPMATKADLDETVRLVEALDRRIVVGQADVRDRESMRTVLETGMAELGRLDFVLANAGIMPIWGERSKTMQAWHDCLDVLLTGVLNTVELTYPHLIEQGRGGSIVITSSMAGVEKPMMRTETNHTLGMLGYTTAKSALKSLMRNYASFLASHSIRVNSVHPTGVNTPMVQNDLMATYFTESTPEDLLTLVNALPVDAVEAVDISNMMVFLCSDESRYFTGNAVRVDAGADLR